MTAGAGVRDFLAVVRVGNSPEIEFGYGREIGRIAGEERQLGADGRCSDESVIGTRRRFPAGLPEDGRNTSEGPGGGGIEGQRVEVCLRLLQVRLSRSALDGIVGDQRTD